MHHVTSKLYAICSPVNKVCISSPNYNCVHEDCPTVKEHNYHRVKVSYQVLRLHACVRYASYNNIRMMCMPY